MALPVADRQRSTFDLKMSEIPAFHQDNPYPERKWVALSLLFFALYYGATRFVLRQPGLPEPYETTANILICLPLLTGGWFAIGRLGYSPLWRIILFIPLLGFLASITFLMLSARSSRRERTLHAETGSNKPEISSPITSRVD